MQVQTMPIAAITPYPNNPRINKNAVESVAKVIKEVGFRQPIVVDEHMVIIVGHTRHQAALRLKMTEVPVHVAKDLTPDQVKSYRISDNRVSEDSTWDHELLFKEIKDLSDAGQDLALTGFSTIELDEMFNQQYRKPKTAKDDTPEPESYEVTKGGDVWSLGGDHLLICGDSLNPETYKVLFGKQKADMVWTDPPYNIDYHSSAGVSIQNDNMPDAVFRDFLNSAFECALSYTKKGGAIYIAHSESEGINFRAAAVDAGWALKQCLIWVKHHFTLSRQDYQWQHEPILYGWKPGAAHQWHGTFSNPTVFDAMKERMEKMESMDKPELLEFLNGIFTSESTIIRADKPNNSKLHPTMKPVELIEKMIKNSAGRGQIVLDPFGGSGSTMIACESMGRKARLIELDPKYCDVIIRRWQDFTGEHAMLKSTGKLFNQVEECLTK